MEEHEHIHSRDGAEEIVEYKGKDYCEHTDKNGEMHLYPVHEKMMLKKKGRR